MKENINYMRDMLLTCNEISRRSGAPMLYLGNPGMAKTTIVNLFAKRKGYHVESVIGSSFDRSEILGYMVNDGAGTDHLITKDPEWFWRIQQKSKEGIPSILFIDEIPTTPKDVQGSLYRLIFERTIGNGHQLPKDCIIVSAGNYKNNLPMMCDITSPSINRFCIINFKCRTLREMILESSQPKQNRELNLPDEKWADIEMTEEFREKCLAKSTEILLQIDETYNNGDDSSKGQLDVTNTELNNIYDADYSDGKEVYNFLSFRTIGYFHDAFCAMASMKLSDKDYIGKIVDGFMGLGCNSFVDIKELNTYRKFVKSLVVEGLKEVVSGEKTQKKPEGFSENSKTISSKVEELSLKLDEVSTVSAQKLTSEILFQVMQEYPVSAKGIGEAIFKDSSFEKLSSFRADFSAMEKLQAIVSGFPASKDRDFAIQTLESVIKNYRFYAETSLA